MAHPRTALLLLSVLIAFFVPLTASADTSVQTTQILPLGSNACAPLTVLSVTPYIQDGGLNSYDLVIADPSYVSVVASVGETSVPFRYMTRWPQQNGTLKIHVDVPSTPVHGTVPVTTTLLSSPTGRPTCLAIVRFTVTGPSAPTHTSSSGHTTPVATTKPGKGSGASSTITGTVTSTSSNASGSVSVVSPLFAATLGDSLKNFCSPTSAYELWFVLLALYIVIVGLTALARPPLYERAAALPLIAILVPLVLFVGFWYFAPQCRANNWIPLALVVAAIVALFVTYRDRNTVTQVIQLPPAKS